MVAKQRKELKKKLALTLQKLLSNMKKTPLNVSNHSHATLKCFSFQESQ